MEPNEFVSALEKLAPEKRVLLASDYPDDEADEFVKSFTCVPRNTPLDFESHGDALLELIKGWDVSGVEIGSLSFLPEPTIVRGTVEVGAIEADALIFRPSTRDFALVDHDDGERVLCKVSGSGESLLKALLCIAGFYAKTAVDEIDIDDESAALGIKSECIRLLGGEEFETFCTTLLGV